MWSWSNHAKPHTVFKLKKKKHIKCDFFLPYSFFRKLKHFNFVVCLSIYHFIHHITKVDKVKSALFRGCWMYHVIDPYSSDNFIQTDQSSLCAHHHHYHVFSLFRDESWKVQQIVENNVRIHVLHQNWWWRWNTLFYPVQRDGALHLHGINLIGDGNCDARRTCHFTFIVSFNT